MARAADNPLLRQMVMNGLLLGLFAVAGTGLVSLVHVGTHERIAAVQKARLSDSLHTLVAADRHDNDMTADTLAVQEPELLGTREPVTVYRARRNGEPVAVVLNPVAPDGYSGEIRLLVAINADGTLAGVRVVSHKETPGLGDKIEAERSDWITRFTGRSLADPAPERWKVKKDGGAFDQFTGATITPRAVVKAVQRSLQYFEKHRGELLAPPATQEVNHG